MQHHLSNTRNSNVVRLTGHRDEFGRYVGLVRHCCPVCYQGVSPTAPYRRIEPHLDSVGMGRGPGSDEPYRITLTVPAAARSLIA